jgi:hypothetical protein
LLWAGIQQRQLNESDTKKWRAQGDDFRTFVGDFVAALPQVDFRDVLGL